MKRRTILLATLLATLTPAAPYDAKLFAELRWRMVGPLRGGRTRACAGVASQPNIFYIGAVNGVNDLPSRNGAAGGLPSLHGGPAQG